MTSQIAGWEKCAFYERTSEGPFKSTGQYLQAKPVIASYWVHTTTGDLYPETQTPQEVDAAAREKAKNIMELHLKYDGLEAASQLWLAGVHTLNRVKRLETSTVQSLALAASFLFLCMSASEVGATISTITYLAAGSVAFVAMGHYIATVYKMQDKKAQPLMIGMGALGVGATAWICGFSQGLWDLTLLGVCAATVAAATCLVGKRVLPAPRILPSQPTPYDPAIQARASWTRFKEMIDVRSKVSALKMKAPTMNGLAVLGRLKELDEQRTGSKKSWAEFQRMSFLYVIDQVVYKNMSISWAQSEQMERVGNLKDQIEGGQLRFERVSVLRG